MLYLIFTFYPLCPDQVELHVDLEKASFSLLCFQLWNSP